MKARTQSTNIGTMQEKSLHAALKKWYARRGDRVERNFSALKRKLTMLTTNHPVRLVYPIALEKSSC